jgi:hypothetical protein
MEVSRCVHRPVNAELVETKLAAVQRPGRLNPSGPFLFSVSGYWPFKNSFDAINRAALTHDRDVSVAV